MSADRQHLKGIVTRLRAAGCVFAEDEAGLLVSEAQDAEALERMIERRLTGAPLEYILGWGEFAGLRIAVGPPVFVPRRRTEAVAREAAALAWRHAAPRVIDLCCGAGAIGAAIAARVPTAEVWASDIDPHAVSWARQNLPWERVVEGDLFDPLPDRLRGRVDVVVANAPYVPTEAIALMPQEARLHEAAVALDGGADGLDVHRRILDRAGEWLAPQGELILETSVQQAEADAELFRSAGLEPRLVRDEENDGTAVIGRVRRS